MSALDSLERIVENPNLFYYPFRYCFVGEDKIPYSFNGSRAHPNKEEDFGSFEDLINSDKIDKYAGVGISIIGSKICAIDVDKCFQEPFNIKTGDSRAQDIIELFKDKAYIEFSFSGRGLRLLFVVEDIPDYIQTYYIKNDKTKIEYYQPGNTPRYVTVTGKYIYNNELNKMHDLSTIYEFLNKYMLRPKTFSSKPENDAISQNNDLSLNELLKKVKSICLKDIDFQDLWFMSAQEHMDILRCHIQGESKESNADFKILSTLYNYVVDDKNKLRELFESSPYFQNKDDKHTKKWYYNNYRYYNYIYEHL